MTCAVYLAVAVIVIDRLAALPGAPRSRLVSGLVGSRLTDSGASPRVSVIVTLVREYRKVVLPGIDITSGGFFRVMGRRKSPVVGSGAMRIRAGLFKGYCPLMLELLVLSENEGTKPGSPLALQTGIRPIATAAKTKIPSARRFMARSSLICESFGNRSEIAR